MPIAPTALALILPNAVNRYVALLVAAPDVVAGTYVELGDADYVRVAHSSWVDLDLGDGVGARANNGAVVFPAVTDADTTISHWAIFDAATNGNLLAAGPLLNGTGNPQPQLIATNDVPRFNDQGLRLRTEP